MFFLVNPFDSYRLLLRFEPIVLIYDLSSRCSTSILFTCERLDLNSTPWSHLGFSFLDLNLSFLFMNVPIRYTTFGKDLISSQHPNLDIVSSRHNKDKNIKYLRHWKYPYYFIDWQYKYYHWFFLVRCKVHPYFFFYSLLYVHTKNLYLNINTITIHHSLNTLTW